jgi:glyoxylase-like metal-dependent hydrolase (beta-lactamase superfamily II)
LDEENRVLIAGDSISKEQIFMFGAGRDIEAYIYSMEKLSSISGRFDTVYPSHGGFPVEAGIIGSLIDGAKRIRDGKADGVKPSFETPALLYNIGVAKFLYGEP